MRTIVNRSFSQALLLSLAIFFAVASAAAFAQQPEASLPTVADGYKRILAGDHAGAITILEEVTKREPKNARAWRVLALAYIKTAAYDKAIDAYRISLEIEPGFPTAIYNTGVAYALKGDKDAAFDWLGKAKASKKVDMTQIEVDADLASLKGDPRFAALMPTAEEFAKPFKEDVRVLREWDGEAANDQFGWIARPIGDVDGDHVTDIVTSAPTSNAGGASAGRVYVYSTRTGKLLWKVDGNAGDSLGLGVEGAGDANGDGIGDVVAAAPGGGYAVVYSGKDGHVLFRMTAEEKGDNFGRHVSTAGDVDRDGHADVFIGAPGNNAGGKGAGRAYVYSGKNGHLLLTLTGEREGDGFGNTVGGYTDKQRLFLIVGAPAAGSKKSGRVYVYDALSTKPKFTIESDETGIALGQMFVSAAGDLDGDKVPDIYASDFSNGAKGPSTGRVYVHSGKSGKRLFTFTGETAGEGFGIGPAVAGDVDHDGHADLIVGAWQYGAEAVSGGRAYLYSGADGRLLKTYTCKVPGDTFGFDAVGLGDTDGDGTIDFLLTSAWSGIRGYHSGRMFVISSGVK